MDWYWNPFDALDTRHLQVSMADITTLAVEAVMIAANPSLPGDGGVDGAGGLARRGAEAMIRACLAKL